MRIEGEAGQVEHILWKHVKDLYNNHCKGNQTPHAQCLKSVYQAMFSKSQNIKISSEFCNLKSVTGLLYIIYLSLVLNQLDSFE